MKWLLLAALVLVLFVFFTLRRSRGWVADEARFARINAEVCPVCGQSRIFFRDGRRMLAPPHPHVYSDRAT